MTQPTPDPSKEMKFTRTVNHLDEVFYTSASGRFVITKKPVTSNKGAGQWRTAWYLKDDKTGYETEEPNFGIAKQAVASILADEVMPEVPFEGPATVGTYLSGTTPRGPMPQTTKQKTKTQKT